MARRRFRPGIVAAAGLAATLAATYLALPRLFTKDDAVAAAVRPLTPQVGDPFHYTPATDFNFFDDAHLLSDSHRICTPC